MSAQHSLQSNELVLRKFINYRARVCAYELVHKHVHTAIHSGYTLVTQTSSLVVHPSMNQPLTLCIPVLGKVTLFAAFRNYLTVREGIMYLLSASTNICHNSV